MAGTICGDSVCNYRTS